jgi:uncharacterized damage-inducible protein DinB
MIKLFSYNWQVREEWFEWCRTVPNEELTKERKGGMNSILHNLLHVINCERIWISRMAGKPASKMEFNHSTSLDEVIFFSNETKEMTQHFFMGVESELEDERLSITSRNGTTYSLPFQKVLLHIITHEVHHLGQLSVWSREIDKKPVPSDLIFRDWQ